nr:hypothetical protein B0A51_02764 [Rachicladosporium sp. CCFEE 5018]
MPSLPISPPEEHPSWSPELELGENDIRLLSFAAAKTAHDCADTSVLTLKLATYSRSAAPAYIALSYVWGDDSKPQTVLINGKDVLVRDNLHTALIRLRDFVRSSPNWPTKPTLVSDPSGTRLYSNQLPSAMHFWVDAQCIDQANIDERNRQVRVMRDIYADASSVFAWTGELSAVESAVLDRFFAYLLVPPDLGMWTSDATSHAEDVDMLSEKLNSHQTSRRWMDMALAKVVRRLSTAKNFTRMWCAQE